MALFRGRHLADCQFCCRVIALAGNRLFAAIFICAGLGTASPCCHLRSYHAAALRLVNQFFPEPVKARGHALYSSTSFGIGGGAGTVSVWSGVGEPGEHLDFFAGCTDCLAGCICQYPALEMGEVNGFVSGLPPC